MATYPTPDWLRAWFRAHGYDVPDEIPTGTHHPGGSGAPDTPDFPPVFSFDPQITAQDEAVQRGLEDLLVDTATEKKYAKKDAAQNIKDLLKSKKRGLTDVHTEKRRSLRDINLRREDVATAQKRNEEDFSTRLSNLIHGFQVQGTQQYEAANATGTLDPSTQAASAAARAGNFARARQPLDTALARSNEDAARDFLKLDTAEGDLRQDTRRSATRLRQDTQHDIRLSNRDLHRALVEIHKKRQRARREALISHADLMQEAEYQVKNLHPSIYQHFTGS